MQAANVSLKAESDVIRTRERSVPCGEGSPQVGRQTFSLFAAVDAIRSMPSAAGISMNVDANSLLAGMLVSSIGFVLLVYGRRMGRPTQLIAGIVLLVFPYFVASALWILAIGAVLLALLWVLVRAGF